MLTGHTHRLHQLTDLAGQGTLRPELGEGIRSVTKRRAIIYFDVIEAWNTVRILAVFFGGQDHQNRMLIRLLGDAQNP